MKGIIQIEFDYTHGYLSSYSEVLEDIKADKHMIFTNCLNFFSFDYLGKGYDVIVRKLNGQKIVLSELLENTGVYTDKEIRKAHNVYKMLLAGAIRFRGE